MKVRISRHCHLVPADCQSGEGEVKTWKWERGTGGKKREKERKKERKLEIMEPAITLQKAGRARLPRFRRGAPLIWAPKKRKKS